MPNFANIGDWVQKKYGGQAKAAKALKTTQGVVSQWISGRSVPLPEKQALMAKNGYDGPFPEPKKKASAKAAAVSYVTREDFAEYRGTVKNEISNLKDALEKALELIRDLALRLPEESRPKGR